MTATRRASVFTDLSPVTCLPASNQNGRFQPLQLPGLFSIQVSAPLPEPKECYCLAAILLSAFADYSDKLAATQSVFLANQIHDCATVLNLRFARVSVCRLSPVNHARCNTTEVVYTCRRVPERYVSTSFAADRCPRLSPPDCHQPKLLSQL